MYFPAIYQRGHLLISIAESSLPRDKQSNLPSGDNDPYYEVQRMLKELDLMDLIEEFKYFGIRVRLEGGI